jgi:hypothetical protein
MTKTKRRVIVTAVILVTVAAVGLGLHFLIRAIIALHS